MTRSYLRAFTLVELLVVITIIVVLLSLLAPALDQAVYQAELVLCASKLDLAAAGVAGYALDHARRYPRRDAHRNGFGYARPNMMTFRDRFDDLAATRPYIPLKVWIDPLNAGLSEADIDRGQDLDADCTLFIDYAVWYDWGYPSDPVGAVSSRMGQGFSWRSENYSVLISDMDLVVPSFGNRYINSHPGKEGAGQRVVWKNEVVPWYLSVLTEKQTSSIWVSVGNERVDSNYAMSDGSVTRYNDVAFRDDRLGRVATDSHHSAALGHDDLQYIQVPH